MRAIPDRKLAEPFRSWIDRGRPLPAEVQLFPRTIDARSDLVAFVLVGGMFGGMAMLILLLPPWHVLLAGGRWEPLIFLGAVCGGLCLVPWLLGRRIWRAFRAEHDRKAGVLREGVFIGPEGMLVRMEANCCQMVPVDRFIGARIRRPSPTEAAQKYTLIMETMDGRIECFAERLTVGADKINGAARKAWRSWSPPRISQHKRQTRKDLHTPRLMRRLAMHFGGAMLMLFLSIGLLIVTRGDGSLRSVFTLGLVISLLGVAVTGVRLGYWFIGFQWAYRCPECGCRVTRNEDVLPAIHYYCEECNIEWDSGLHQRRRRLADS